MKIKKSLMPFSFSSDCSVDGITELLKILHCSFFYSVASSEHDCGKVLMRSERACEQYSMCSASPGSWPWHVSLRMRYWYSRLYHHP